MAVRSLVGATGLSVGWGGQLGAVVLTTSRGTMISYLGPHLTRPDAAGCLLGSSSKSASPTASGLAQYGELCSAQRSAQTTLAYAYDWAKPRLPSRTPQKWAVT